MSDWLTPAEAAAYLKLTEQDLVGLRRLGGPKYAQKGSLIRYKQADLDEWLASEDDPDKSDGWEIVDPGATADSSPSDEGENQEVALPPASPKLATIFTRGKLQVRSDDGNSTIEAPDPWETYGGAPAGVGMAPPHIVQAAREGRPTGRGDSPLVLSEPRLRDLLEDLKSGVGEYTPEERQDAILRATRVLEGNG